MGILPVFALAPYLWICYDAMMSENKKARAFMRIMAIDYGDAHTGSAMSD